MCPPPARPFPRHPVLPHLRHSTLSGCDPCISLYLASAWGKAPMRRKQLATMRAHFTSDGWGGQGGGEG